MTDKQIVSLAAKQEHCYSVKIRTWEKSPWVRNSVTEYGNKNEVSNFFISNHTTKSKQLTANFTTKSVIFRNLCRGFPLLLLEYYRIGWYDKPVFSSKSFCSHNPQSPYYFNDITWTLLTGNVRRTRETKSSIAIAKQHLTWRPLLRTVSDMLHLEHRYLWCSKVDTSESRTEIPRVF